MVGAVLVRDGEVVGSGWHRQVGGPHAEVEALREAGDRARGATLYVNLEPCAHHGRTPPCADAVIAAGISKVVACHADPDPRVSGRGFAKLREAGIEVEVGDPGRRGHAPQPALPRRRYAPASRGHPQVGHEPRRQDRHGNRGQPLDLLARRPALGSCLAGRARRHPGGDRHDPRGRSPPRPQIGARCGTQPAVVILDRRLRTPPEATLFKVAGPVLIYTQSTDQERHEALAVEGGRGGDLGCCRARSDSRRPLPTRHS